MKRKVVLMSTIEPEGFNQIPLPLLALGTVLENSGYAPFLVDVQTDLEWENNLVEYLKDAMLFSVTCMTGSSITGALKAIKICRAHYPKLPILWWGYYASAACSSILHEKQADYVIKGPGEEAIIALCDYLDGAQSEFVNNIEAIPNLAYLRAGEMVENKFRMIADMESLPLMNYDLINVNDYYGTNTRSSLQKRFYYSSSYGCPGRCAFCSEESGTKNKWQGYSASRVASDLERLWKKYSPERIQIVDPSFSSDPKRVVELVSILKEKKQELNIMSDMRVSEILEIAKHIDLKDLREIGFEKIYIGIESGSNKVLKQLNKNFDKEDAYLACKLLNDAGITTHASIVHDFPEETTEDTELTFELCERLAKLKHNRQFHHLFTPIIGSPLYRMLKKDGYLGGESHERWAQISIDGCGEIWQGRKQFREFVVKNVDELRKKYPATMKHQSVLEI